LVFQRAIVDQFFYLSLYFKYCTLENRDHIFSFLLLFFFIIILTAIIAFIWFTHYRKKLLSQIHEMKVSQKILLNEINRIAETEKETIAKNLHDDIGSQLSIIKLMLVKISRNLNHTERLPVLIGESMILLDRSIDSIRSVSRALLPPALFKLGYAKAISELCRQINRTESLKIELEDNYTEIRLSYIVEVQIYRIVQEIINNLIKHSEALNIKIYIDSDIQKVDTIIVHDGKGLSEEMISQLSNTSTGIGFKNMESRLEQINASINYFKSNSNEFVIKIEIPFYEK